MAEGKSAHREDLIGFGGFTFANNSADKKDHRAAVRPAAVASKAQKVPTDTGKAPIPHGKEGHASYAKGFGGSPRDALLVWVASEAVAGSPPKPWYRYTLYVSNMSVGIRLTAKKRYDELDMDDGFEVEIQLEQNGPYQLDPDATLVFDSASLPNF